MTFGRTAIGLLALLVWRLGTPAGTAVAQPPRLRLQLQAPPQRETAPAEERPGDLVMFAGRTVEFKLPTGWTVKEVPVGRDVRLLVGPGQVPDELRRLERGFWLAYRRYVYAGQPRPPLELELRQSIGQATRGQARPVGPPRRMTVDKYPALQQNLELPSPQPGWFRRASHLVAQTPWGSLEIHGVAPVDVEDQVRAGLKVMLKSMRFHEPRPLPPPTLPEIVDAGAALGTWKGPEGRLHLNRDGKAELHFDRIATFRIDQQGRVEFNRPGQRLAGRFTAQRDVIYISWNDGGRLNYRWKMYQGELWLLDHHGRSLQLKRLFDAPKDAQ